MLLQHLYSKSSFCKAAHQIEKRVTDITLSISIYYLHLTFIKIDEYLQNTLEKIGFFLEKKCIEYI